MKYKIVYNTANGLEEKAFKNPRREGEYIFPGGCIEEAPPEFDKESQICKYVDGSWVVEDKPEPEKPDNRLYHEPAENVPGEIEEPSEPELTLVDPIEGDS